MFTCKPKLGIAIEAAGMLINQDVLISHLQYGKLLCRQCLTLILGTNIFEPVNFITFATSDLRCSKKQNKGIDIVLTVLVKSYNRSARISESLSTTLSRLLCSPSETADAMEAITDAFDWYFDPRCGVPKKTTPATDLIIDG